MLKKIKQLSPLLVAGAMSAAPGRPIATVTSAEDFTLSGVRVSAATVSSWPVTIGDEIKDLTAPAVLRFADNTQIAVGKGSSLKLESEGGKTIVRLTGGSMTYRLGNSNSIQVFALQQKLDKSEQGVSVNGQGVNQGQHNGPPFDPPGPPPGKPPGRSKGE